MWMRLSGAEQLAKEHGSEYARSMLHDSSAHDNDPLLVKAEIEIEKDIARTLTDKMMEGFTGAHWNAEDFHVKLKRLLLAYARHNRSADFVVCMYVCLLVCACLQRLSC